MCVCVCVCVCACVCVRVCVCGDELCVGGMCNMSTPAMLSLWCSGVAFASHRRGHQIEAVMHLFSLAKSPRLVLFMW